MPGSCQGPQVRGVMRPPLWPPFLPSCAPVNCPTPLAHTRYSLLDVAAARLRPTSTAIHRDFCRATYVRHGTTTLFAALDIVTGQVITQCKKRHRHQEFLAFLRHIDANVPEPFDVHLIADNYATHKHPKVRAWLARRPRYHIHYTPTYASWLNQVERWFGIITQTAIRRGSFSNVSELVNKIDLFVHHYNAKATPFMWTATADSILAKVQRLCSYISGTQH